MKKLLSVLLTLTLLLALSAPAFAAEDEPPDTTATVSTFEELQAAVAAADDGDTIVISNPIGISGADLITDKQIIMTALYAAVDIRAYIRACAFSSTLAGFWVVPLKTLLSMDDI